VTTLGDELKQRHHFCGKLAAKSMKKSGDMNGIPMVNDRENDGINDGKMIHMVDIPWLNRDDNGKMMG